MWIILLLGEKLLSDSELKVRKIKDGTVIDHIPAGNALAVLKILNITGREGHTVSIVMNVSSKRLGLKDIVKIEGRELKPDEVNKIALIAPNATINIVRNYQVVEKKSVTLPSEIYDILSCPNPMCVTNANEPVTPRFYVDSESPLRLRCHYCGWFLEREDVLKQI